MKRRRFQKNSFVMTKYFRDRERILLFNFFLQSTALFLKNLYLSIYFLSFIILTIHNLYFAKFSLETITYSANTILQCDWCLFKHVRVCACACVHYFRVWSSFQ